MCCTIKQFFGKWTLQSGAITAAITTGIMALAMIIYGALILIGADYLEKNSQLVKNEEQYRQLQLVIKLVTVAGAIVIIEGLIAVIISICLAVAVYKKISGLVMAYLIGSMIIIVLACIGDIFILISGSFGVILHLIFLAFYIYLWIVVYNYHQELRLGRTELQRPYPT